MKSMTLMQRWNRTMFRLRFGLQEMRKNWGATFATLTSGTLTVMVAIVVSSIGIMLYQAKSHTVDTSMFTRIELRSNNPDDPTCRFTPATLRELTHLPGVLHVFQRLDVDVELSTDAGTIAHGLLEGSPEGDHALDRERLTSGATIRHLPADGMVLSPRLARDLFGESSEDMAVIITVRRRIDDVVQTQRLRLRVVDVLTPSCREDGYLSLDLAWQIDLWLRQFTDTIELHPPVERADEQTTPVTEVRDRGTIRATLDAQSIADVESLMKRLSHDERWEVVDRTGGRQALVQLGLQLMAGLGTVFGLFYLLAAVAIISLTYVGADARRRETVLLRSMGLRGTEIAGIRIMQSGWLSVLSTTFGLGLAAGAGWVLHRHVLPTSAAFTLPGWEWIGGMYAASLLLIFVLTSMGQLIHSQSTT